MRFSLNEVHPDTLYKHVALYRDHYDDTEVSRDKAINVIISHYAGGVLSHFMSAQSEEGVLVSTMGIVHIDDEYLFSQAVTHKDYRRQGLASNLIKLSTPMLLALGPRQIRSFNRTDKFPSKLFDDLGFEKFDIGLESMPFYKHTHILKGKRIMRAHN